MAHRRVFLDRLVLVNISFRFPVRKQLRMTRMRAAARGRDGYEVSVA